MRLGLLDLVWPLTATRSAQIPILSHPLLLVSRQVLAVQLLAVLASVARDLAILVSVAVGVVLTQEELLV